MRETPEETPILGGAKKSEPVVTAAPSAEPVAAPVAAAPKKKSHAGLIVTIIILAVLLIGGGVAAFLWLMWHESAETSINDAMAKSFEVKDRTISGTMNVGQMGGVKITLDGSQSDGNLGGSGKISLGAGLVELKFNAALIKGGDIYIKLDGIKDALKNLPIGDLLGSFFGMSGANTGGVNNSEVLNMIISEIGEVVDGEWIKITAKDIKTAGPEDGNGCDYNEVLGLVNGDAPKELAETYKKNPFIVQKKDSEVKDEDGVKYYEVEIDEEKMTNFTKGVKDSDFGKKLAKCSASSDGEEKGEEGTFKANKDTKIYLGIKPWSHELAAIKLENDKQSVSAKFEIGYEKKAVEEPSKAKTIDDLQKKIEKAMQDAYTKYLTKYMNNYGNYGGGYGGYSLDDLSGLYGF